MEVIRPIIKKTCVKCGTHQSRLEKGGHNPNKLYEHWHRVNGEYFCSNCYNKSVTNPKWQPVYNPIINKQKIKFRDKQIFIGKNPRKGQCQNCKRKVGDTFIDKLGKEKIIKHTDMHHIEYHDGDPLKDTIELCPQCHTKLHAILGFS